eukprot:1261572-Rhodomonas_salina.1
MSERVGGGRGSSWGGVMLSVVVEVFGRVWRCWKCLVALEVLDVVGGRIPRPSMSFGEEVAMGSFAEELDKDKLPVKGITCVENVSLVNLEDASLIGVPGVRPHLALLLLLVMMAGCVWRDMWERESGGARERKSGGAREGARRRGSEAARESKTSSQAAATAATAEAATFHRKIRTRSRG